MWLVSSFSHAGIGWRTRVKFVISHWWVSARLLLYDLYMYSSVRTELEYCKLTILSEDVRRSGVSMQGNARHVCSHTELLLIGSNSKLVYLITALSSTKLQSILHCSLTGKTHRLIFRSAPFFWLQLNSAGCCCRQGPTEEVRARES